MQELDRVLPVLQRVHDERNDLKTSKQRAVEAERRSAEVRAAGEAKKAAMQSLERDLVAARAERARADERAAGAAVQNAELLVQRGYVPR